jgi:PiT family inorganic phosphate transporter
MIILFYLSSGLFLGWSLGANNFGNIFGTAVGSRMVKFRAAAIVGSIFVILGSVIQGAGANEILGKLGGISTLPAAFTVALASALTVYWMTQFKLPVSVTQAIVGAIIGWNYYTGNPTDSRALYQIVSTWVSGPVLGGIFSVLFFILIKYLDRKTKMHLLFRDFIIRYSLIIVGAMSAYSLGANNISNVMGVFTNAVHFPTLNLGIFSLNSLQQLFLIGGVAIALGIITYSKRVMETVGEELMPLSPKAAIAVILSQAIVLFIFSSVTLSNWFVSLGLPPIPLVPVSSSQVVIGSIFGIGIYKGGKQIKYNILGSISLGWVVTPLVAGILTFFLLFFVNNVFKQDVGKKALSVVHTVTVSEKSHNTNKTTTYRQPEESRIQDNLPLQHTAIPHSGYLTLFQEIITAFVFLLALWFFYRYTKLKKKCLNDAKILRKEKERLTLMVSQFKKELNDKISWKEDMKEELKFRQNEMVTMAMSIIHKNEFLNKLKSEIVKIKTSVKNPDVRADLNKLSLLITQDLNIDRDREKFQLHINELNSNFMLRLTKTFPGMTENEKRLASLLRLNLSSKEIASILNISPKSVEMNRYRLRKKLKVDPKVHLNDFIRAF